MNYEEKVEGSVRFSVRISMINPLGKGEGEKQGDAGPVADRE